jgi:dihydroorotase-like cyclic amidohydrolase
MAEGFSTRLALVSRHVVLYSVSCPTYAVVLIADEVIQDVVRIDPDRPVEDVMLDYLSWNPLNFEHLYISPGLIDFNMRREQEDWEDLEHLTQAAVAGGVTLVVEETLFCAPVPTTKTLYCDVGRMVTITADDIISVSSQAVEGAMAVKGFLTPPNSSIGPIEDIAAWLSVTKRLNLPIIIDAEELAGRALYLASPYRSLSYQDRADADESAESVKVLGGAMNATADSSDDEDSAPSPYSLQHRAECKVSEDRKFSLKQFLAVGDYDRRETRPHTLGKKPLRKHQSLHNIHSALAQKISDSLQGLDSLCRAELMAYQGVGNTRYFAAKPVEKRGGMRKPTPLALTPSTAENRFNYSYIRQVAHYPRDMEVKGVNNVIAALEQQPCRVHFANLSSAQAVMQVHKARLERLEITCETCPHFLLFTDQYIGHGDTRFKNYPPICDKTNCNFLWELLKVNSIDVVCSQHIAVPEKYKFEQNFRKAVNGINGLGFTLQTLWTVLKRPYTQLGRFEHYIVRIAKWTSLMPAKVLMLPDRGAIAKGYLADLVIWDPLREVTIEKTYSSQPYQCPYVGLKLFGNILKVFVRGHLVFTQEGQHFYPRGRHEFKH